MDATLLAEFSSDRIEGEAQSNSGKDLRIVKWTFHTLVIADDLHKGYLRTATPPAPLVESLDRAWWLSIPRVIPAYRRIEGDWYLFLEK